MLMVRLTPTAAMAGVTFVFAVAVVVVVAIRGMNAGIVVISGMYDIWRPGTFLGFTAERPRPNTLKSSAVFRLHFAVRIVVVELYTEQESRRLHFW